MPPWRSSANEAIVTFAQVTRCAPARRGVAARAPPRRGGDGNRLSHSRYPMLLSDNVLSLAPAERPAAFDARRELAKLAGAQRRMLPQSAPDVSGYALALAYRPACAAT